MADNKYGSFAAIEDAYGEYKVTKMRVARRPLISTFVGGNLLGWYARRNNPHHDSIFHAFAEFALEHPTTGEKKVVRVEKAESLHAYEVPGGRDILDNSSYEHALSIDLKSSSIPTVGQGEPFWVFLERTKRSFEQRGQDINDYNLADNNCQGFLSTILKANGLWNGAEHHNFINQDTASLIPKFSRPLFNAMTNYLSKREKHAASPSASLNSIYTTNHLSSYDADFYRTAHLAEYARLNRTGNLSFADAAAGHGGAIFF